MFKVLDSGETNINFKNIPASQEGLNILYYIYYYNGAGVAAGDINNDGYDDIFFAANDRGKNRLYLNRKNLQFEDITETAGVAGVSDWCTGVTMADVNGDGYLDIYVCAVSNKHGLFGYNELYINNRNETFTESSALYGLNFSGYSTQSVFFDYDHDGDLDCYVLNQSDRPHQYIVDTSNRRRVDANAGDRLYRNDMIYSSGNPAGKFTDVSAQAGIYQSNLGYGLGLAVADLNNDGWEDIYVGNDFHENDYYYINNRHGGFTESGAAAFNHYSRFSMGNDVADYNNDGHPDILTVDMLPPEEKVLKTYGSDERLDIYKFKILNKGYQPQVSRNCLQRNNGNGKSFSDVGLAAGIAATDWSWSPLMADFNNDGFKDIFISSGIVQRPVDLDYIKFVSDLARMKSRDQSLNLDNEALSKMPEGSSYCYLFKGNGEEQFADSSSTWGIAHEKGFYTGAAYADFDNDGDLDIVVNPVRSTAFIYQNGSSGNFIQFQLKGDRTNSFGIGAKAYVFQKGNIQYQQLMLTRGFQSSSTTRLHFGLSLPSVDSVLIIWPDSSFQVLPQPAINKLHVVEKSSTRGLLPNLFRNQSDSVIKLPSLVSDGDYKHQEDIFDDFAVQYLLPHGLSKRGPKIATADINKDGLDDFYVCGPKGQAGQLFIQRSNGLFSSSDTSVFSQDKMCEDVDALFLDVNADGFDDLYVASGGNVYQPGNPQLHDRLYINDSKGHFKKSQGSLPDLSFNKSCIAAGDVDGDKDIDLFVGILSEPGKYGISQSSYLLLNDGTGVYKIASNDVINLRNAGMITSASFSDVNKDGATDLILAGEWMPVFVYLNKSNKFSAIQLSGGSGLWQCLDVHDVNSDGYPDILAGNWGLNSKLIAGKAGPLKLHVKDFDNNGTIEPILTYTINNIEYTFLPKDELEQVLPGLKKKFLYYNDFAAKPVSDVFDLSGAQTLEAHDLASAIFLNAGKGNFTRINLPINLQLTPIFSFQNIGGNQWLAGGNFYDVLPYEGQYDSGSLLSFEFNNQKAVNARVLDIKGQVRDIKEIITKNGKVFVISKNNDSLSFYRSANEKK